MAYKVIVYTDDDNEYELGTKYNTYDEAETELNDIVFSDRDSYIDGSAIRAGKVERD